MHDASSPAPRGRLYILAMVNSTAQPPATRGQARQAQSEEGSA